MKVTKKGNNLMEVKKKKENDLGCNSYKDFLFTERSSSDNLREKSLQICGLGKVLSSTKNQATDH